MTEKRYSDGTLAKWYYSQTNVISDGNNEYYLRNKESTKDWNYNELLGTNDLLDELNKLSDENEQLKDKYNEQSVEYEGLEEQVERLQEFKDKVFNLINAEIRRGEQIIDGGERIGANVSVMIFHIVLLNRLKEELKQ